MIVPDPMRPSPLTTETPPPKRSLLNRFWSVVLAVGPGIFCIGYTVGTGSVTTMCKAGSMLGLDLLWLLLLCSLFMGILMEAFGRYAVVTGETAIHSFRTHLQGGPLIAVLVVAGIVMAQYGAIMGILGLCSSMISDVAHQRFPDMALSDYWTRVLIAIGIVSALYALVWVGTYTFFEKVLVFFVTLMGITFLGSMFIVLPAPSDFIAGLMFHLPTEKGAFVLVPAIVGTTMAAATFVVRPLLVKAKGWDIHHLRDQSRDSITAAVLMFIVSLAVMASATGALHQQGQVVEQVMDMVKSLEPAAGKLAMMLFFAGTLSAGLSSLFPIIMVAPLLIADYRNGKLETTTPMFRILSAVACLIGLTVPLLGFNPVQAQIVSQIGGVFVLPLCIGAMIVLVNRKDLMGEHRAGHLLNAGLAAAFLFSLLITYTGCVTIIGQLKLLMN
ncbi:NRAMP family divalent metal transporter [Blastopirellula marina]|uniref:Putative Mn2+ Fe2+ transporter n=1 Tax=Blastopirellula marina DSM 3645 TaxID=314230 RepID=A3ZY43_9BACT|nr:divalent metal cation transporter [Blastopirellula marina]EAQ78505.1 putative Mn2+ Fe2+ transporter [Blastopirellula marina DSM 3645]